MKKPTSVLMQRGKITTSFGAGSVAFLEKQGWVRKSAAPRVPRTEQDEPKTADEKANK